MARAQNWSTRRRDKGAILVLIIRARNSERFSPPLSIIDRIRAECGGLDARVLLLLEKGNGVGAS